MQSEKIDMRALSMGHFSDHMMCDYENAYMEFEIPYSYY